MTRAVVITRTLLKQSALIMKTRKMNSKFAKHGSLMRTAYRDCYRAGAWLDRFRNVGAIVPSSLRVEEPRKKFRDAVCRPHRLNDIVREGFLMEVAAAAIVRK